MNAHLAHHIPGRSRFYLDEPLTAHQATVMMALLETIEGVSAVHVNWATRSVLLRHDEAIFDQVCTALEVLTAQDLNELADDVPLMSSYEGPSLFQSVFDLLLGWGLRSLLPMPVRAGINLVRALPLLSAGWSALREGHLNVEVLDASAVGVSLLRGDAAAAGSIMTLLALGEIIEEYTRRRSRESLAKSLAIDVDFVFRLNEEGVEEKTPLLALAQGDKIVLREGSMIPVDGRVIEGEGSVNQASLTGESMPVYKAPGLPVYAGTVLEEGRLVVSVTALPDESRLSEIGRLIDESEATKATVHSRAERLADKVVPFSFLLALGTFLLTGDPTRAAAALVVDYSCAIKLTTPLTILSAMREGVDEGAVVKGGKFLEALATADTVVFDKTGTLTVACPQVKEVVTFEGFKRDEALRLAACLEEHYPHSIATAVVRQAELEGLSHREEHADVEYVIAHGLASTWRGHKVVLGSRHFVLEDQAVPLTDEAAALLEEKGSQGSLLYLAIDGALKALLVISDPLREDAAQVVQDLRAGGVEHIEMLTGDNRAVAGAIARQLDLDSLQAELLPADKINRVKELKAQGRKVVMVGDGVNDSPALAEAHCGVSFRTASDVAREVADVVLTSDLSALPRARTLAQGAMRRIERNYAAIVGFNSLLLGLGLFGFIAPTVSALLHNSLTIALSAHSLSPLGGKK